MLTPIIESIRHALGLVGDCQRDCLLYRWCGSGTAKFKVPDDCLLVQAAEKLEEYNTINPKEESK